MQKLKSVLLLSALAATALPGVASAQTISSPYRFVEKKKDLGVFAGYMFAQSGQANIGPKAGPLAGAHFSIRISDPIQIGTYLAYFPTRRDVMDPSAEGGLQKIGSTDFNMLLLTGQLQLFLTGTRKWHNLIPYVFGGLGAAFDVTGLPSCLGTDPNKPADCRLQPRERFAFGTSFMGQIGIGLIWLPGQRIGFRFTADDSIWRLSTPDGYYDETSTVRPIPPAKNWTNNIQLTLGVYYWF
jgi:hypothetical protein